MLNYYKDVDLSIKSMRDIAEFILDSHKDFENVFITKYKKLTKDKPIKKKSREVVTRIVEKSEGSLKKAVNSPMMNNDKIREELIQFRLHTSRKEEVKAYFIFNNKQLEDIMEKMTQNEEELMRCNGFGKVKVGKYGLEMLRIIKG